MRKEGDIPKRIEPSVPGPNRAQRRKWQKESGSKQDSELHRSLTKLSEQRSEIDRQMMEENDLSNSTFARRTYRTQPLSGAWLAVGKNLHQQLERAAAVTSVSFDREKFEADRDRFDVFARDVNGISLLDIEVMKINPKTGYLRREDEKRINKMFKGRMIPVISLIGNVHQSTKNREVLSSVILFAAQPWAQPQAQDAAPSLKKLRGNLNAYLDHYVDLITAPSLDPEDNGNLVHAIAWGGPEFCAALSVYLPARLGITSSSATKLYKQKEQTGFQEGGVAWKRIRKKYIDRETKEAYLEDGLPQDLFHYQFYDEEIDKRAGRILEDHYRPALSSDADQLAAHEKADHAKDSFGQSFPRIIKQILKDPQKRLDISIPNTGVMTGVTVTAVNRRTAIFIVHLGADTHVTLEMNKEGQMYGIPPELLKSHPHIGDMLAADILPALVDKFTPQQEVFAPNGLVFQSPMQPSPETVEEEAEEPRKKVKTRGIARRKEEPELPIPNKPEQKLVHFVPHSEDQIRELLGGKKIREQDVARVMNAIQRFEQGNLQAVRLTQRGHTTDFIRLRSGNLRIALKMEGGKKFSLIDINDREVYDSSKGYGF